MILSELPLTILDNIINNINDTKSYASIRQSCKSIYYLLPEVRRYFTNKRIRELFVIKNHKLNGYHILWYVNKQTASMVLYINSKKHREQIDYYASGNVKKVSKYLDGKLNGISKSYSNYSKKLTNHTEYRDNKKINDELIYTDKGVLLYKKYHLDDNFYTLTYYDDNYRSIHGTFINEVLQGNLIVNLLHHNNIKYYRHNKVVKKFSYGSLESVNIYKNETLIENFKIKDGLKDDWAFKWHLNHKLKSLCYFSKNMYQKKLKIWHENGHGVESIDFKNDMIHGVYKSTSKHYQKTIPFNENKIDGYVVEKYKSINSTYKMKFKKNLFDGIVNIENNHNKEEMYIDKDYFIYNKYIKNKKKVCLKIINNFLNVLFYDDNEKIIYNFSKIIPINFQNYNYRYAPIS